MPLQMIKHFLTSWIVPLCVNLPHFLYLGICWWIFRSFLPLGSVNHRYNEPKRADTSFPALFSFPSAVYPLTYRITQSHGGSICNIFEGHPVLFSVMTILRYISLNCVQRSPFLTSSPTLLISGLYKGDLEVRWPWCFHWQSPVLRDVRPFPLGCVNPYMSSLSGTATLVHFFALLLFGCLLSVELLGCLLIVRCLTCKQSSRPFLFLYWSFTV